eukprot:2329691-Ditylum_brightwellii.AAC.1
MLGKEATMVLKQISRKIAQKWDCSQSLAANYVKTTVSLLIICATHQVLSRMMSTHQAPCEDGAAIGLLLSAED